MFGRKKAGVETVQVEAPESYSVQFTRDAVIVESTSMDFSMAIIEFWEETHGGKPNSGTGTPAGFSTSHMTDLESDVDHAPASEIGEDYYDEDEDDD